MADTLDHLMKEAVARGLTALTVWPCQKGWQCNARFKRRGGQEGWVCVTDTDAVRGTLKALGGATLPAPEPAEDAFG